jgi:hypothetical protein
MRPYGTLISFNRLPRGSSGLSVNLILDELDGVPCALALTISSAAASQPTSSVVLRPSVARAIADALLKLADY